MADTPKISILIPIYNVEKYLRQCLNSIVGQTLDNIEIICINDGSKDSSLNIIKEYESKDKRIKIIDKNNTGYGHSMNTGLDFACGEYIGIVEPDDFAKQNMFEDLYNLAKKFDSDIVKSEYYGYTTNKGKGRARKTGKFIKFKKYKPLNLKDNPSMVRIPPSIWSAIYKREWLKENNIRFLETPGASYQDTLFSFKSLCLANKIVFTPKAYIFYRQDNADSSVNSKDKIYAICREYDEITDFLNQNPNIKKTVNSQKLIKQYVTYMWNLKRIDEKLQDGFIEKFSAEFKMYFDLGEISDEFFRKVDKKEFLALISNIKAFKKQIKEKLEEEKRKDKRRKMFSIRINPSRISVVLFGKHIVEIG